MKIGIITRFGMPLNKYARGYYYRLYYLANGLVDKGHKVTVLGHPKSDIKGKLVKANVGKITWEKQLAVYAKFLAKYGHKFDIINAQTDHLCCFFAPLTKTPLVHTIIFGHFWDQVKEALKMVKGQYFSTISHGCKKAYPFLNWQGVVHNGLNSAQFKFNKNSKDYLLFLSRVDRTKGIEDAIKVAKKTKNKLIIAGQVEEEYFNKTLKPIFNKDISYAGIVGFTKKINLLKNAKVLLHPHLYSEGFGNTIIEAQACGTPVIASPYGSVSEVIKDKKTGFIVNNNTEMARAIKNIKKIKREDCRKFIEEKFTIEKMVAGYENLFKRIIKSHKKKIKNAKNK